MMTVNFNISSNEQANLNLNSTQDSNDFAPSPISFNADVSEAENINAPSPQGFEQVNNQLHDDAAPSPDNFEDSQDFASEHIPYPEVDDTSHMEHVENYIPEPIELEAIDEEKTPKRATKKSTPTSSRSKK